MQLTISDINQKIDKVEFVRHTTAKGKTLCWCVIELKNGFAVTGRPSIALDPKADNLLIGEQIAYNNAYEELRALEGYLLTEKVQSEKSANDNRAE
jgi:hypothetical protein